MNLTIRFACFFGAITLTAIASATPVEEVRAILRDFLNQPNYTWQVSDTRGKPEDRSRTPVTPPPSDWRDFHPEEVSGQHERGGYTKMYFFRGPHILPWGTTASTPWEGITDQQEFWSGRWVFATPDGWRSLRELPNPPGVRGTPLNRSLGRWRPDLEIAIIVENLSWVEQVAGNVFRAELTASGATKIASVTPSSFISFARMHAENARVSVSFSVRDGSLVRYELSVDTDVSLPSPHRVHYDVARELTNLGTTFIDIPEEAVRRLRK